jgi:hypothetical protein
MTEARPKANMRRWKHAYASPALKKEAMAKVKPFIAANALAKNIMLALPSLII